jgi:chitodextrinase
MIKKNIFGAFIFLAAAMFITVGNARAQQVTSTGPTIPTAVNASVNRSNQVYVSWNPSTETSTPVIGYYLYRNGTLIANTPGYTFYTDTPTAGIYSYTVSAYDRNGLTSSQSAPTTNVNVVADTIAPTTPTGLVASISSSSVSLSWTASTDNFGVIGYYIYKNGSKLITNTPITGTSYLDSGLQEGNSYTYSVVAYDAAGNLSNPTPAINVTTIFDVQAPTAPQGLSAKTISPSEIDLTWQPSTDNVFVSGYYVYRNGTKIATTASTTYNDTALIAGTNYGYSVYAYDEVGNVSVQGAGASAATFAADHTPPSTPGNFNANALSGSQVSLNWSSSTDNVGVASYYLYRNGTQILTTTSTTYVDPNLASNTTYEYIITALDAAGNVSPQASLAVKTLSTPAISLETSVATTTVSVNPNPIPSVPVDNIVPTSPSVAPTAHNNFTTALYYGLRSSGVQALQTFLTQQGYLSSLYDTGFYGNLTVGAVQKFQCAQNIICSGSAFTTGWGLVGPRTRAALNAF